MDLDPRLAAATERLMRLFRFSRPNAETLARTVLTAADEAVPEGSDQSGSPAGHPWDHG